MKKMLDELKKLDMEYEVPQDFRKKVMSQIKIEATQEKTKVNKIVHLKKYVIACASVAAMFIVVVNVGNLSMKGLSGQISGNTASIDSAISMAPSKGPSMSANTALDGVNGVGIFNGILDNLKNEDVAMDSVANKAEIEAAQKFRVTQKSLEKELERINISYEEIKGEIFIQKIDLQALKDTMDKEILDNLEFIEKDDKIQIIIK